MLQAINLVTFKLLYDKGQAELLKAKSRASKLAAPDLNAAGGSQETEAFERKTPESGKTLVHEPAAAASDAGAATGTVQVGAASATSAGLNQVNRRTCRIYLTAVPLRFANLAREAKLRPAAPPRAKFVQQTLLLPRC